LNPQVQLNYYFRNHSKWGIIIRWWVVS
jgi:hypothetical protein